MARTTAAVDTRHAGLVGGFAEGAAFVRGEFVPVADALVAVLDWGFTRSDVAYDVVHVWQGSFFRLDDHLNRFGESCRKLCLDPGYGNDEIRVLLMQCVRLSGQRGAYVDFICTRDKPQPGSRNPRTCDNQFMAFAIPFVWVLSPEIQVGAGHLYISDVPRIPAVSVGPPAKNFPWGDLTRGLFQAFDEGADTAVLVDPDGFVSEGLALTCLPLSMARCVRQAKRFWKVSPAQPYASCVKSWGLVSV